VEDAVVAATVEPERILKDLARLWADLGHAEHEEGVAGVLRACAMTLIVAMEQGENAQDIGQLIAELMHQHPSRAIVINVSSGPEKDLDARVLAQCWMPFGSRQQICCEQIEITAPLARVEDLPKLVLGVIAPDLPVVLWCRSFKLASDPGFQQLLSVADKLILDSAQAPSEEGLTFVRDFNQRGRVAADLAWTRLTRWRESIAQIFDNEANLAHLREISEVRIGHGGARTPVSARYLASWFAHALPSKARITFEPAPERADNDIYAVVLEGPGFSASVELDGPASVVLSVNQISRRASFPPLDDCGLLREELSILGPDPVFRDALQ
jgi:glucose-6-phosphate dehydrogenase assembly protein OpcA